MLRRTIKIALGTAVVTAIVAGTFAVFTPAQARIGNCVCPAVYAPVKCSNGRTYSNACVASCHRATGCVPTGNI